MSVRRAGLSVTGDKREEVERRAGRNSALPKDMMEVWMLDLPAQLKLQGLRSMPYTVTAALHYAPHRVV